LKQQLSKTVRQYRVVIRYRIRVHSVRSFVAPAHRTLPIRATLARLVRRNLFVHRYRVNCAVLRFNRPVLPNKLPIHVLILVVTVMPDTNVHRFGIYCRGYSQEADMIRTIPVMENLNGVMVPVVLADTNQRFVFNDSISIIKTSSGVSNNL
jgi:hypothetical protein